MMTITVLVISKDDLTGLRETLNSIASQHTPPDELIVVTKGDSDNIRLADYALPRGLKHVIQKDKGISAAFNLGLSIASCEWINFLNGGDIYAHPDVLTTFKPRLHEGVDILAGRALDVNAKNLIPRDIYFISKRIDQISHQASLFRLALFKQFGGYSLDYHVRMDFEWMLRVSSNVRVAWINEDLVNFKGRGVSSINPVRSCQEELKALRLHNASWSKCLILLGFYMPFRTLRQLMRDVISVMR
jgi:glycosyltransferase involved in cell wall biosynthesis